MEQARNTQQRHIALSRIPFTVWVIVFAANGYAQGPTGAAVLEATTPAATAAAFKADAEGWAAVEIGYGGPATGDWTYALGGDAAWTNYRVECRVHLVQPATRKDGLELRSFVTFDSHARLGGYEAGLILRHQSPRKHYRLAVSSLWKEIILWRPSGGVVQAVEFPFEVGKTYHIVAECHGPRICVRVDGRELIDWWDTADPVESGQVGLARKEGESYFTSVKVGALDAPVGKAPPHVARFRERQWHGQPFFFDGNEPIFTHKLDLMKFRPGYRPLLEVSSFVGDTGLLLRFRKTERYTVAELGEQVIIEMTGVDPKNESAVTCLTRVVVRYDAATDVYAYDHCCTTRIPERAKGKAGAVWDHGNTLILGAVGSANTRDPDSPKPTYHWIVIEGEDGKFYKVPLNHNIHYDGAAETSGCPVKPGGFGWVAVGDSVLSPTIRMQDRSPNFADKNGFATCWWAYDVHIGFYPKLVSGEGPMSHGLIERCARGGFYPPKAHGVVLPGEYRTRVIYSAINASEARDRLAKAEFYQPVNLDVKIPVYTAGIGFREPFDKTVLLASPHTEHRIWAGVIDEQVGHDSPSSLRLDGPTEAYVQTGRSYFSGRYPKKVRVSGWVKTKDVQGEGPAVGFRRFGNRDTFEFHNTGVTGTTDWTPFSYVTGFPANCFGVTLYWRNSGTGTAWFDDFQIEPVDDDTPATARNYPVRPADADIVLKWGGRGDARGAIDTSGYGSHGKFYDQATLIEERGTRVIKLRGPSSYIWPLSSPNLSMASPVTLAVRLKPEAAGYLLFWDFNFLVTGKGPKFGIGYQENTLFGKPRGLSDPMVASKPFLQAGKWQTLVIVAANDQIKLYCDGKLVETLAATVKGGNWGPMAMDDHQGVHRRLSFFGSGPGDALILASDEIPPRGGGMKGKVSEMVIYRRALDEREIEKISAGSHTHSSKIRAETTSQQGTHHGDSRN